MKKVAFLFAALLTLTTSCSAQSKNKAETTTEQKAESKTGTIHLTKAEFLQKVYNFEKNPSEWKFEGSRPAIVDFYATWCGPCKMVAPILEELANEYSGKLDIYKIDTDKEQELAGAFGITSIPTILFIPQDGKPQIVKGAMPKGELKKIIDEFLLAKK